MRFHVNTTVTMLSIAVFSALCVSHTIVGESLCTSHSIVSDCSCSFKEVGELNKELVKPILSTLTETTQFFRFFRVHLCGQCKHNLPPPLCASPECSVCECEEEALPCDSSGEHYLSAPQGKLNVSPIAPDCDSFEAIVDPWSGSSSHGDDDDPSNHSNWIDLHPELIDVDEWSYVNLMENPERWTGYKDDQGSGMIWKAVHIENSFVADSTGGESDVQRIFTRIMNGLHSSISAHIVTDFCQEHDDTGRCLQFGVSLPEFERRLHAVPERIDALHFLYLFVLKAVLQAKDLFLDHDYHLRDAVDGELDDNDEVGVIEASLTQLFERQRPSNATCRTVPEITESVVDLQARLSNIDSHTVETLQSTFRNITSVMDCVGCDKCRLWGKLQVQGIATALQLMLPDQGGTAVHLQRNDLVAIIWLLKRLSESVQAVGDMTALLEISGHV